MAAEMLSIAGCRTRLVRRGQGAPILFLHDEFGTPPPAGLAALGEVIAPELPGFGESDTPDWFDNIQDSALFVQELLHALALPRVHVVGCSLGGWLAVEVAMRSTAGMASLVLCGAMGIHVKGAGGYDPFLVSPEEEEALRFAGPAPAPPPLDPDTVLKNRFAYARLAWAPRLHDPHLEKWLHRLRLPTLVLHGAEDRLLPPAIGRRWAEAIPGARLRLFPGCGHAPELEQPAAFCAAIGGFIAEQAP